MPVYLDRHTARLRTDISSYRITIKLERLDRVSISPGEVSTLLLDTLPTLFYRGPISKDDAL